MLRNNTTNGSLRMARNPPTPTSLPNTRFSARFRNNLIVNNLSSEGPAPHSKLHIPHDETCLTESRNMPNLRAIAYLSSLERWPFATRKMPNGNDSSHTSHPHWAQKAPGSPFSASICEALRDAFLCQIALQKVDSADGEWALLVPIRCLWMAWGVVGGACEPAVEGWAEGWRRVPFREQM